MKWGWRWKNCENRVNVNIWQNDTVKGNGQIFKKNS